VFILTSGLGQDERLAVFLVFAVAVVVVEQ
jgi:hypothetical protein